ncbi:hypothetical protein AB3S75_040493 [Citrus x aurantiifolia]
MAAENGRVHPNCVNASNPYHECGMACLEKIAQGHGHKESPKKKLDYHNGVKEGVISKMKNEERKVNPNCIKASNPYHECGERCFKRNGEANALGFKKQSDNHNGVTEGVISVKKNEGRKVDPTCIKASNPYHECGEHCFKRNGEANARGVNKESGSWSFGRKNKASDSQPGTPLTPRAVDKVAVGGQKANGQHARSENYPKKKVESENGKSFSRPEHFSREIHPEDHSLNKEKVRSAQSVPPSENIKMNDMSKSPPKESVTSPPGASPSKNGKDNKVQAPIEIHHSTEDGGEDIPSPADGSRNFSFSGIDLASGDSDDEEAQSVISDSVSVGKYHVRASISSILQSIISRYGDIAANCNLESNSMRAYYLECLCSVVQELQSTSLMQMTKAKVKEMMAVLKDVESAQIDVDWLRNILNEISEAIEFSTQHQTIDAAKANCANLLESTKKELESQMNELALKEKEVAGLKESVAKTKARLSDLELESNRLEQIIQATQSKLLMQ